MYSPLSNLSLWAAVDRCVWSCFLFPILCVPVLTFGSVLRRHTLQPESLSPTSFRNRPGIFFFGPRYLPLPISYPPALIPTTVSRLKLSLPLLFCRYFATRRAETFFSLQTLGCTRPLRIRPMSFCPLSLPQVPCPGSRSLGSLFAVLLNFFFQLLLVFEKCPLYGVSSLLVLIRS